MNRQPLAWLAILVTTVVWASSLIFAKIVFVELTPMTFVALRYTLACPFLIVAAYIFRTNRESSGQWKNHWQVLLAAGLAGPFLSQILQYIGLNLTTASDVILLINLSPVFAVLLAAPVLNERITAEKSGGLLLATLGASLILMSGTPLDGSFSLERLLGDVIVIVSTFFFAVNGIVGKIAVKSLDSISVTLYSTLFAVPFIWVSAAALEDVAVLLSLSPLSWAIVLWVGVVNTAFAFMLYYEAMKHIEASKVQIALNLIAVWGVIMSVLVLGESISLMQILGGGLTVIGVLLAQRSRDKSEGLTVESTAPVG